jgi:hypothetical protein
MMNRSIAVTMSSTSTMTTTGYVIAERTLRRSSTCFSIVSASLSSTESSTPPTSPALTIAT